MIGKISPGERLFTKSHKKLRDYIFAREPLCRLCENNIATQIDHIVPLFKGGGNEIENLQPICEPCHIDKSLAERGKRGTVRVDDEGNPVGVSNLDRQYKIK